MAAVVAFERLWQFPGTLDDAELEKALASAFEAPPIAALMDVLLDNRRSVRAGLAKRDTDLEDQLQFEAFAHAKRLYPDAVSRDGSEIACHLFAELAARESGGARHGLDKLSMGRASSGS